MQKKSIFFLISATTGEWLIKGCAGIINYITDISNLPVPPTLLSLRLRKKNNRIMYRTHTCGELRINDIDKEVTLAGWVQTVRKFGSITFVDLRDRYGITQLLFGEELNEQLDENPLGREFVLQATGTVNERSNKNPNIPTGDIEINISSFKILNKSAVPPFTIQDDTDGGDDLRMKYRFLDLRRNAVKKNLELRYAVNRAARNYLHENGFMDIETPFLIKSTPEGARDFVVPSQNERRPVLCIAAIAANF